MSGLLASIAEQYKELINELDGAVSDKEYTGLLTRSAVSDREKEAKEKSELLSKGYNFITDKGAMSDKETDLLSETKGADSDADTLPATIRYLMSKGQVELAGLVSNGKIEPQVAINIANSELTKATSTQGVLGEGAMSQEEIGKYPDLGWTNVNDSQEVKTFLNNIPHADRVQIEAMRQRVTGPQFQDFLRKIMAGQIGGGAIHEALPFQQYKTGNPHLQNLGFVGGAY